MLVDTQDIKPDCPVFSVLGERKELSEVIFSKLTYEGVTHNPLLQTRKSHTPLGDLNIILLTHIHSQHRLHESPPYRLTEDPTDMGA